MTWFSLRVFRRELFHRVQREPARPHIHFTSFYPGWMATDGRVKLVEVFGAFQGIVITEAGNGRITLHFSPLVFKWGIAITLLSIAATALLAFTPVGILLGIKTRND